MTSPTRHSSRRDLVLGSLSALTLILGALSCQPSDPKGNVEARKITSRIDLIGGDRALGDIGDYLLANDKVRVVIQAPGFSRGFGVYGGSLIDADLRRPREEGNSGAGIGYDAFGELFPAFFVQACAVDDVKVLNDGSNGKAARIEASGSAGDFLELVGTLNRAVTGSNEDYTKAGSPPQLRYSTIYELSPGASYVDITFRVTNITADQTLKFPGDAAASLLGSVLGLNLDGFTVPIGDVALFGATSKVFLPGAGFDLRFTLEDAYARNVQFPAFPGIVTDWVASRGSNVSYGLLAGASPDNYALSKKALLSDGITPITESSMLVPFVASSFIGVFYKNAPAELKPGESFDVKKYFVIGNGDVGSVLDTINEIQGVSVGRVGGQVVDAITHAPIDDANLIVYQHDTKSGRRRPYSQYSTREGGFFEGTLAPGSYSARIANDTTSPSDFVDFEVTSGRESSLVLAAPVSGRVVVNIRGENGEPLPAKATAVGRYDASFAGKSTREFLFDLRAGDHYRTSDFVEDDPGNPSTLRYVENVAFTQDGDAELILRPGHYQIVSSRGPEYDLVESEVDVAAGGSVYIAHQLSHVVKSTGWIAGDMHMHSRNSIDSKMDLDERIRAAAAEGVEWAVSTDHNYVTDYEPYIARNNLRPFLRSSIGLEMTTLESGHFNGYPLKYDTGGVTHGSFEWARRPPKALFEDLRRLGSNGPENTIVQVNHPRDQILGYFEQYNRDALTGDEGESGALDFLTKPTGPAFLDADEVTTFSFDFEAMELTNGKLYWEIHHFRVPDPLPSGELPDKIPPKGTILLDKGEVAYPGVVDDWFNLLNLGYRYIGVGTGDSHSADDEAGQFRTMIFVGKDDPRAVSEAEIIAGLRSRHVVATNGPIVDFWVDDPTRGVMGQTLAANGATVKLSYSVTAAPWMSIDRINIYRNGVIAKKIVPSAATDLAATPIKDTVEIELATDADGNPIDSWFVVEAIGYRSMFPVVLPTELPPLVLTDAVASLAGPLGLGSSDLGALKPAETFAITPYAITNPVWVTSAPGKTWEPPGVVPSDVQISADNDPGFQQSFMTPALRRLEKSPPLKTKSAIGELETRVGKRRKSGVFYPRADNPFDVRKALVRMGYGHGHSE
ncbi:MAG: hypothetical protein U0165_01125 [Polyangiaceae bacterium]